MRGVSVVRRLDENALWPRLMLCARCSAILPFAINKIFLPMTSFTKAEYYKALLTSWIAILFRRFAFKVSLQMSDFWAGTISYRFWPATYCAIWIYWWSSIAISEHQTFLIAVDCYHLRRQNLFNYCSRHTSQILFAIFYQGRDKYSDCWTEMIYYIDADLNHFLTSITGPCWPHKSHVFCDFHSKRWRVILRFVNNITRAN